MSATVTRVHLDSRDSSLDVTLERTAGPDRPGPWQVVPPVTDVPPDYVDALLRWVLDHPRNATLKDRIGGLL